MNRLTYLILLITSLASLSFNAYADLDYKTITAAYKKSYQYEKTENYNDAIKAIMIVYNHYSKAYTVNLRLGHLYLQTGKFSNATRHYQLAQKALPYAISPKIGQMSIGIAQGHYERTQEIGFTILKTDPYNYYGNIKLAYVLTLDKKYESAQAIVEKMLAIYPEDVLFISQYAANFAAQGLHERASEYYSNALILDPENVEANYYFSLAR